LRILGYFRASLFEQPLADDFDQQSLIVHRQLFDRFDNVLEIRCLGIHRTANLSLFDWRFYLQIAPIFYQPCAIPSAPSADYITGKWLHPAAILLIFQISPAIPPPTLQEGAT